MSIPANLPPLEIVSRLLFYNKRTGALTWRVGLSNRAPEGSKAGTVSKRDGYRRVTIEGKRYMSNQVCWLLVTGQPAGCIVDHKNGVRSDDRWLNLRKASKSENGYNAKRRVDNTTGVKGVHFDRQKGKYKVEIAVNGRKQYIGAYHDLEQATRVRKFAEQRLWGEYRRET